jgi:pimeloyl-ACP methyl ester carboxylesterase
MRVEVDGVGTEFSVTGEGTPVVLLHGFPDTGRMWRNQVPALAEAGLAVIVPDLRGFGASDKPADVASYNLASVAGDVLAILDQLGHERAHIVGHDWGAGLAWVMASLLPDRVDQLVALSVGHPNSFRSAGWEQREKSWYMLLFQFEGVAEQWLSQDGWANLRAWGNHPDFEAVVAGLQPEGALTAALGWYRANVPPESLVGPPLELPAVAADTMGIWSTGDFALTEKQMKGSGDHVTGEWRYERVDDAGHWVALDRPDEVNRLLLDFLRV